MKWLTLWGLALAPLTACGQERTSFFVELLGNGGLYSVNVEQMLTPRTAARVGAAHWKAVNFFDGGASWTYTTVPVLATAFAGRRPHRLEVGAGILAGRGRLKDDAGLESYDRKTIFDLTAALGYRYERPSGGIQFRATLTPFLPLLGDYPSDNLFLSAGLSLGYAF